MIKPVPNDNTEISSFNIYIDLFSKGEFNEMLIVKSSDNYQVNMENFYLGTLSKSDNKWEVTEGTIPSYIIPDITRNIK